jgi:hypothetical protein
MNRRLFSKVEDLGKRHGWDGSFIKGPKVFD